MNSWKHWKTFSVAGENKYETIEVAQLDDESFVLSALTTEDGVEDSRSVDVPLTDPDQLADLICELQNVHHYLSEIQARKRKPFENFCKVGLKE